MRISTCLFNRFSDKKSTVRPTGAIAEILFIAQVGNFIFCWTNRGTRAAAPPSSVSPATLVAQQLRNLVFVSISWHYLVHRASLLSFPKDDFLASANQKQGSEREKYPPGI
jgi:hypothetical protein